MQTDQPPADISSFNPVALIRRIRDQAAVTLAACDQALAAIEAAAAATPFRVPDESEDFLSYRRDRRPTGQLSDRGKRVAQAFLLADFTDEAVGELMNVSPWGIGQLRRRLGLPYGHRKSR